MGTALAAGGCNSTKTTRPYPSSSSDLVGTWIGTANGITLTTTLGIAQCNTEYGFCHMRVPATYQISATGETGTFSMDLAWLNTSDIGINFVSDQQATVSYRERFIGALIGATLVGAIGPPFVNNSASVLDALLSTSITFNRQ
jgi:hypothetical protein